MTDAERLRGRVAEVAYWFHSIELGHGIVTPGHKTPDVLAAEVASLDLPDLTGRSVLDVGGWDGFFGFHAERCGAARVAVLDHHQWSIDLRAWLDNWETERTAEERARQAHEWHFWQPETMPGKLGFEIAREALGSRVEDIAVDFMTADLAEVGVWDVVLYLGVLYHIEDPLSALRRLAEVTRERLVLETEAVQVAGYEDEPLWRFFPFDELAGDATNWWAPNVEGLRVALRSVGFDRVEVAVGPPAGSPEPDVPRHFRAIVHAIKDPA